MHITVLGAHGQTGQQVVRQALDSGHTVRAVSRRPREFPLTHERLTVAGADVYDGDAVDAAVDNTDAVISTLGVPMRLGAIDIYSAGTANIVTAMQQTSAGRLVVVSSTAVTTYPGRTGVPAALKVFEPVLKSTIGRSTYADQRRMEALVRDSGLDWTIVRPSGLFDTPAVTEYVAGQVDPVGAFTSRADLAHYLLTLAQRSGPTTTVTVSTVENTPSLWDMVRQEAFRPAQPKNAAASS